MDKYKKYFWDNPPKCLKPFVRPLTDQEIKELDIDVEEFSAGFGIRCLCGHEELNVLGEIETGAEKMYGPVSIYCSKCRSENLIFDPTKHGHDGEFGQFGVSFTGQHKKKYKCQSCQNDTFSIVVEVDFTDDIEEFEEIQKSHVEDYFFWINISTKCNKCNQLDLASSIECS